MKGNRFSARLLMVDNYDSFTYNLVHLFKELEARVDVVKNDQIPFDQLKDYDGVVLSPGPGIPEEAGDLLRLIRDLDPSKPLLGICLGHQAIGLSFGHEMLCLDQVYHGVASTVKVCSKDASLFAGIPDSFAAARYHSWVINENRESDLLITAKDENGAVMALEHKTRPVFGLQFHPESILTPEGKRMLRNFLIVIEEQQYQEV